MMKKTIHLCAKALFLHTSLFNLKMHCEERREEVEKLYTVLIVLARKGALTMIVCMSVYVRLCMSLLFVKALEACRQ